MTRRQGAPGVVVVETFEAAAFVEDAASFKVTSTVWVSGESAGTADIICPSPGS